MSFFRYPGGKTKLYGYIAQQIFSHSDIQHYIEPFFGGGSVGLKILTESNYKTFTFNDKNIGLICLWKLVKSAPETLKRCVRNFVPSTKAFYLFKQLLLSVTEMPLNSTQILQIGFMQLVIHQISYSGLGVKSGSPLGGKQQKSKYKIDCRWSPKYICKKIDKLHGVLRAKNIKLSCVDFDILIKDVAENSIIYLDPPYYIHGNTLYQYGFTIRDHKRLCNVLRATKAKWVLSYDDCPEIRQLYAWANIATIEVNYTIHTSRDKKELLITCPQDSLESKAICIKDA